MNDEQGDDAVHAVRADAGSAGAGSLLPGLAAPEPRHLVPLLVEQDGPDYGLVWVLASRSELKPGAVFPARGSRWVVIGHSPSGVTYTCREVTDDPHR
jgi:hypothetical protein